ncbi:hypothetical protein JOQ06_027103 [Pogonophryne albipinna]|uniref:Uncharacterized protein n=1 Tax=Pogonophryne albipinna TaxID=1090488 RepID=A0AAD6FMG6_9TELE|nr:hypothetical protein JOQ06_027103 [Pogonophryne albipinna]
MRPTFSQRYPASQEEIQKPKRTWKSFLMFVFLMHLTVTSACETVILVVMHHTFNKDQILPPHRDLGSRALALHVDCLFHEQMGILKCPCNDNAIKMVRKQLKLNS